MAIDIVDACPECKGTDVTCLDRLGRGHQRPRCYCYDCGTRFNTAIQINTVTGERV